MRINRGSSPRLGRDFSAKNDIILRRRGGGAGKLFHGIVSFPELRYTVFRFPRPRVAREEETVLGWKTTRKLRPGEEEGTCVHAVRKRRYEVLEGGRGLVRRG